MTSPFNVEHEAVEIAKVVRNSFDPAGRMAAECIERLLTETARLRSVIAGSPVPIAQPEIREYPLHDISVLLTERQSGLAVIVPRFVPREAADMGRRDLERRFSRWLWASGGPLP